MCLLPKTAPTLLGGRSSATVSTRPGIKALADTENKEVSLLGMSVVSETLRGSCEGDLGGLGLAGKSEHPDPQTLLCP